MKPSTTTTVKAIGTIFKDDPEAITKLHLKIAGLEKEKAYWKTIKKCVPRDYSSTPEDAKWYMPGLVNAKIRSAKKKIAEIEAIAASGKKLVRNTTYKHGGKKFFYTEEAAN